MDFSLSQEQQAFCETARQFMTQALQPNAGRWDAESHFPVEVLREAGQLGFMGLYTPESAGGLGLSRLDASLIFEVLSQGCTATTAFMTIHNMATWMVATWAGEQAQQEWSQDLASGARLASYCLTEPDAGSDAASLRTKARRDGDDYILDGTKAFISGAGSTQALVMMARTGGEGARGISCFLVPADAKGISYGRNEEKMGWKCQPTRQVRLDAVRVPCRYRLGEEGDGFAIAMRGLDGGRINIASCSLGTAAAALTQARHYVAERQQFGQPLSALQSVQFRLADMATDLVAAQQMVRMAAWKLDQLDPERTLYCAMAKRLATDLCFNVCNDALQLHGGYGYIAEYPLERHVRDSRVHQILEGTNEIMRVIIARRLLADVPL